MAISSFSDARKVLESYIPTNKVRRYNLETITRLMEFLGNPQESYKVVHVAGTSGKTSTSYFISSLLSESGFKVGLTVSPYIAEINERVQLNGTPLPEESFCTALETFMDLITQSKLKPTYFELLVAFAFWQFAQMNVDYAVVEVGLGGLLDGTNVIQNPSKICVITDIGMDHTEILGDTIEQIARQKAGIIHPGNTVFMNLQALSIQTEIEQFAAQQHATLHITEPNTLPEISDLPDFQYRNLQLAVSVVNTIKLRHKLDLLTENEIRLASHITIPGRMEQFSYKGKIIILDGAHNPQKIAALVKSLKHKFVDQDIQLLVSFGDNKATSLSQSLSILKQLSNNIIFTSFSAGQDEYRIAINPVELQEIAQTMKFSATQAIAHVFDALEAAVDTNAPIIVVTGSFFLVAKLRSILVADIKTEKR